MLCYLLTAIAVALPGGRASADPSSSSSLPISVSPIPEDVFPILPWETAWRSGEHYSRPGALAGLADCGFTVAAFVGPEHLAECRRLGLKAIVGSKGLQKKWKGMSDTEVVDLVTSVVAETDPADDLILGYYIVDEPGTSQFPQLGKAVETVKKLAPGKLAYINLFPDYATIGASDNSQLEASSYSDYLSQYIGTVRPQFLSYDNYKLHLSDDQRDTAPVSGYYRNLLHMRKVSLEHNLPFWNIVSSNRVRPWASPPSPASLLVQAYTTLAAGGKGLTWFTYFSYKYAYAPVDMEGRRTQTWSYLRMVNEQVRVVGPIVAPMTSTGVYFQDTGDKSLPGLPGEVVQSVKCGVPLMIGEFRAPGGERCAMIVNISYDRSARVSPTFQPGLKGTGYVSPADGSLLPLDAEQPLLLPPGQGLLIRTTGE